MKECSALYDKLGHYRRSQKSAEKTRKFNEVARTISLTELERNKTQFASCDRLRKDILNQVITATRNDTFPFRGHVKKIGSCWDGSKIGHLDEVDTLFILDETEIQILQNGITIQNEHFTASQFVKRFADSINKVLSNCELPSTLEHGGYAAPEYSGVRMNGPAVTLLFSVTQDVGGMKKGDMVTVDIALAVPFSCLRYDSVLHDLCHDLASWVQERSTTSTTSQWETWTVLIWCSITGTMDGSLLLLL